MKRFGNWPTEFRAQVRRILAVDWRNEPLAHEDYGPPHIISAASADAYALPRNTWVSMSVSLMDSGVPLCTTVPLSRT